MRTSKGKDEDELCRNRGNHAAGSPKYDSLVGRFATGK